MTQDSYSSLHAVKIEPSQRECLLSTRALVNHLVHARKQVVLLAGKYKRIGMYDLPLKDRVIFNSPLVTLKIRLVYRCLHFHVTKKMATKQKREFLWKTYDFFLKKLLHYIKISVRTKPKNSVYFIIVYSVV